MSIEILNTAKSLLTIRNACFLAASVYGGRKICLAAGYKLGSTVINQMDKQKAAEWNKTGQEYYIRAKKDAVDDLTSALCFIILGLISSVESPQRLPIKPIKKESINTLNPLLSIFIGTTIMTNAIVINLLIPKCIKLAKNLISPQMDLIELSCSIIN